MKLIIYVIIIFWLLVSFWSLYLSLMNLKRNKDKITKVAKVLAYPMLFVGIILDVIFNLIIGTILFLQLPKEWVFTSRLSRNYGCGGWREKISIWFCHNLLDPFDPNGQHCRPKCKND